MQFLTEYKMYKIAKVTTAALTKLCGQECFERLHLRGMEINIFFQFCKLSCRPKLLVVTVERDDSILHNSVVTVVYENKINTLSFRGSPNLTRP